MNVGTWMTRQPVTCRTEETLRDATRRMWSHNRGCLPVVDAEERVVGMLTDRDVTMAAFIQEATLDVIHVGSAMSPHVRTCHPEDSLAEALAMMRMAKVRRLPVVDDRERLIGLLSIDDLAIACTSEHDDRDVNSKSVTETLAAVARVHGPPHEAAP